MQKPWKGWGPVFVGLISFLVFLPAVRFGFINWDDPKNFLENMTYRSLSFTSLKTFFTSYYFGFYMPLTWVSSAVDYRLYGLNPQGFHFSSLLIHAASSVLLALLLQRFVRQPWVVLTAALFWAIHPLRVEPVLWLSERRELLSGFFFLAALLAYARERIGWTWVFFVCGMFCKASAAALPVLLILYEWPNVRWKEKIPFFAVSLALGWTAFWGQHQFGATVPLGVFSTGDRLVLFLNSLFFYVQKTLCPLGLSPYYEVIHPIRFLGTPYRLYGIGALLVWALAWAQRTERPWVWKGWVAYVVLIAPLSGLLQSGEQLAADRYSYLPGILFSLGLGYGLDQLPPVRAYRFGAVAVLVLLLGGTFRQMKIWSSYPRFIQGVLRVDPDSAFGNTNWGALLASQGQVREAVPYFEKALKRNPHDLSAAKNLERARLILYSS